MAERNQRGPGGITRFDLRLIETIIWKCSKKLRAIRTIGKLLPAIKLRPHPDDRDNSKLFQSAAGSPN